MAKSKATKKAAPKAKATKAKGITTPEQARAALAPAKAKVTEKALDKAMTQVKRMRDPRLPKVGTVVKREYKGKEHTVKVLADGFEYRGKPYRSLSAIAKEIAQCSWNGFTFFGCGAKAAAAE